MHLINDRVQVIRLSTALLRGMPSLAALLAVMAAALAPSLSSADTTGAANNSNAPLVRISTTAGDMVIELAADKAPVTVKNFLQYVEDGFYDGTIFHRVIEGFMIQGGGFSATYERQPTRPSISNEANNGLRNQQYTISMARTNAPHSATAQFFINSQDNYNLDHSSATPRGWGYAVFGKVVEGQNVVENISRVQTGPGGPFSRDTPRKQIVINQARIIVPDVVAEPAATDGSGSNKPASKADSAAKTGDDQSSALAAQ